MSRKRYDFIIIHNGKTYYIEFDGEKHFIFVEYFCKTIEKYESKREVNILKTNLVLQHGDHIIRLDYKLNEQQLKAINEDSKLYLSDPPLYQWVIDGLQLAPITTQQPILHVTTQQSVVSQRGLFINNTSKSNTISQRILPIETYQYPLDISQQILPIEPSQSTEIIHQQTLPTILQQPTQTLTTISLKDDTRPTFKLSYTAVYQ